jgi:hypothetical protein
MVGAGENMKVFWAWQSDHPRNISRDVIRTALEQAVEHIKQTKDILEPPDESRGELHLDHDTKGLSGSPDLARSIYEKIAAAKVFVGDLTPVGASPDVPGNEAPMPGRPVMNPNVAIEYADSDEVARVKRDEAARDSWMMSPAVTE